MNADPDNEEAELEMMLKQAEELAVKMRSQISTAKEHGMSSERAQDLQQLTHEAQDLAALASDKADASLSGMTSNVIPSSSASVHSNVSSRRDEKSQATSRSQQDIEAAVKAAAEMQKALQALGASVGDDSDDDEEEIASKLSVTKTTVDPHYTSANVNTPDSVRSAMSAETSPLPVSPPKVSNKVKEISQSSTGESIYNTPQYKMRQGDSYQLEWDHMSNIRTEDEDYVPLVDYSKKDESKSNGKPVTKKNSSSKSKSSKGSFKPAKSDTIEEDEHSVPMSDYSRKSYKSSQSQQSQKNTHTNGVRWEKMDFVKSHDDDYVPLVDYSKKNKGPARRDEYVAEPSSHRSRQRSLRNKRRKRMIRYIAVAIASLVMGTLLWHLIFPPNVANLHSHVSNHPLVEEDEVVPETIELDEPVIEECVVEEEPLVEEETTISATVRQVICNNPLSWLLAEHCNQAPRYERLHSIIDSMLE